MGNFFSKTMPVTETKPKDASAAEAKKENEDSKKTEESIPDSAQETKDTTPTPPPESKDTSSIPSSEGKETTPATVEPKETTPLTPRDVKDKPSDSKDVNMDTQDPAKMSVDTFLLTEASAAPLPQSPASLSSVNTDTTESTKVELTKAYHTEPISSTLAANLSTTQYENVAGDLKGPLPEEGTIECDQVQDGGDMKEVASPSQNIASVEQLAEELSNVVISTAAQEISTTSAPTDTVTTSLGGDFADLNNFPDVPDNEIVADAKDNNSQDIEIFPEPEKTTKLDDTDKPTDPESEKHSHDAMSSEVSVPGQQD